eukprot:3643157-Amphidinium_carterae.1
MLDRLVGLTVFTLLCIVLMSRKDRGSYCSLYATYNKKRLFIAVHGAYEQKGSWIILQGLCYLQHPQTRKIIAAFFANLAWC